MAMTPDKVLRTDMTKNLTPDEAVAVDLNGNVVSRADRATIERCYPDHAIFGAADFAEKAAAKPKAEKPAEPKAEKPAEPKAEEPVSVPEPAPAKSELVLDPDGNPPNDKAPAAEEPKAEEPAKKDPLDHDGNGVKGGVAKSKAKTA
jgi:hypothetical protein